MKPMHAKVTPSGVFPKRFMLSTLRRLGYEVGLTLPNLVAPANGAGGGRVLPLRVHLHRGGQTIRSLDITPDARQSHIQVWQRQWEAGITGDGADEDLITAEYLHEPADIPWLGPVMAQDVEGQFLARAGENGRYSSVLTSMVPYRAPGYRFTPIIGLTHYYKFADDLENFTLFMNAKGIAAGENANSDGGNRLHIDYYSYAGAPLATTDIVVPTNGVLLHPLETSLAALGVPREALAGGVTSHCRGGASQFSIFTLVRNRRSGAIGIEHSLPPYYYVTGVTHPAIRGPFYKRALSGA